MAGFHQPVPAVQIEMGNVRVRQWREDSAKIMPSMMAIVIGTSRGSLGLDGSRLPHFLGWGVYKSKLSFSSSYLTTLRRLFIEKFVCRKYLCK